MTKVELMRVSEGLSDLYTGLETDLIANIASYLAGQQLDAPTAKWKIQMLAQLGALDRANIATIAAYSGYAPDMIQNALEIGALDALDEMETGLKEMVRDGLIRGVAPPVEKTMERVLKAFSKQAIKSTNMVNTVMRYKAKSAAQKIINDTAEIADKQSFLNMLNKTTGKAVTGMESRQAAMRQCISEMTDKGIPAFVDKRGREWSPEAYVNMDIRTTVSNVAHQTQLDRMDDYGIELVEVSSHSGARPKCAKDQGKIFNRAGGSGTTTDLNGKSIRYASWRSSSYGDPDGLLGINCGHEIYPFVPGVSYQTYFPEPEKENAELYTKLQKQRELERRVRKSKRECMVFEKLDDPEGLAKASHTLKQRQQALKQYCSDTGLSYKADRTAVVGYNKSVAGKVNFVNKNKIPHEENYKITKKNTSNLYSVDRSYINSKSYYDKFKNVTSTKATNESIYQQSKRLLEDRDGFDSERMIIIDERTGNIVVDNLNSKSTKKFATSFTEEQYKKVIENDNPVIILHNHPSSTRPSGTDILSLWKEQKVSASIVIGHDGTVYKISEINRKLPLDKIYEQSYNDYKKLGYDSNHAKLKATNKFYESGLFTYDIL